MFWFVVLLLVAGVGFYFYQKMVEAEREIRAEQQIEKKAVQAVQESGEHSQDGSRKAVIDSENNFTAVIPETSEVVTLKEMLLSKVAQRPGIKQTELYPFFADTNKKQLQKLIKEMTDTGVLKREKQGSSYLLYPAE